MTEQISGPKSTEVSITARDFGRAALTVIYGAAMLIGLNNWIAYFNSEFKPEVAPMKPAKSNTVESQTQTALFMNGVTANRTKGFEIGAQETWLLDVFREKREKRRPEPFNQEVSGIIENHSANIRKIEQAALNNQAKLRNGFGPKNNTPRFKQRTAMPANKA